MEYKVPRPRRIPQTKLTSISSLFDHYNQVNFEVNFQVNFEVNFQVNFEVNFEESPERIVKCRLLLKSFLQSSMFVS